MIRKVAALVVVLGTVQPPSPVSAQSGMLCEFSLLGSVDRGGGVWEHRAEIDGGPIVPTDVQIERDPVVTGDPGAEISLTCTIQAGRWRAKTHAQPDVVSVTSYSSPGIAVVPPTPLVFNSDDPFLYVCVQVAVDGEPRYLDVRSHTWSTSPDVECWMPFDQTAGGEEWFLQRDIDALRALVCGPAGDPPGACAPWYCDLYGWLVVAPDEAPEHCLPPGER